MRVGTDVKNGILMVESTNRGCADKGQCTGWLEAIRNAAMIAYAPIVMTMMRRDRRYPCHRRRAGARRGAHSAGWSRSAASASQTIATLFLTPVSVRHARRPVGSRASPEAPPASAQNSANAGGPARIVPRLEDAGDVPELRPGESATASRRVARTSPEYAGA